MSEKLAILGGPKVISKKLEPFTTFDESEYAAVNAVMKSGVLSQFLGTWHSHFYGGPKVLKFETAWKEYFSVSHAVSVNSATSGLIAAIGAIGIEPGDEVIVSPWTMCATATAILVWNAIPVFADIDDKTFNLDVNSIEKKLTKKTRAIVVPNIFGQAADLPAIVALAKKHSLWVIEDNAQAPGTMCGKQFSGTIGDIGVFSLNYHKHIHTGEGGVCVTNNAELAERMQLIRNHGEAVVGEKGVDRIDNIIGFNFRMGEIEAAIGIEQLKKLPKILEQRMHIGTELNNFFSNFKGIRSPVTLPGNTHAYYIYGLTLDFDVISVSRDRIVSALRAEGLDNVSGGYQNVHLLPLYQKKIAYGKTGYPWNTSVNGQRISYEAGICPRAEHLHSKSFVNFYTCAYKFSGTELDLVKAVFTKVWNNLDRLPS